MGWQLYRIGHLILELKHVKRQQLFVNILGRIGPEGYTKNDIMMTSW